MDEGVGDLGAGEDATTDSDTGVAADSATEDNVATSVDGDEGAGSTDDHETNIKRELTPNLAPVNVNEQEMIPLSQPIYLQQ